MDNELIDSLIKIIMTAISSGVLTFFLTKRKFNEEVKTSEIDNLHKALEFYEKIIQDNDLKLEACFKRNEKDRNELYKLQDTVQYLLNYSCVVKDCSKRKYLSLKEVNSRDEIDKKEDKKK